MALAGDPLELRFKMRLARHRRGTPSLIVVDGDSAYVRSVRGKAGRWYQELQANPAGALHVDGRRIPVTAVPATDPDSVERFNAALRRKYTGVSGFASMLRPNTFETTLRLEPA